MHSTKQLELFLLAATIMIGCAEVMCKRSPATPRYVIVGGVWLCLVGMLMYLYSGA